MPKNISLGGLLTLLVVGAIIAALMFPQVIASRRCSNERQATASLKTITTAEADFRANDRDRNGVNDFWTADVYGLYGVTPQGIRLIERDVAGADGRSRRHQYPCVRDMRGGASDGYLFRAFDGQDDTGEREPTPLMNDTDGPGGFGNVHDRSQFAFMAFPENLTTGKLLWAVNVDNTIWKYNLPATFRTTFRAMTSSTDSDGTVTGTGST